MFFGNGRSSSVSGQNEMTTPLQEMITNEPTEYVA